ncbi:hypothetical protein CJ030_MR2G025970 [Morella rubra]|uniref:non-specific serine/threonine protein kinase n=1 Tax=Morella rubra TaxID=262757 RepID=A0A6A1WIP8_9ROSI|nr:hypothetical protein CJ030_MR2G025970 [Morella rubra]
MSNGSLDQWLHPKDDEQHESKRLSFMQRLNIAIDVACALEYLHRNCQTPIVHCDIKPSNILLDEDLVAHVGDFGLAKFLFEASRHQDNSSEKQTMSAGLKGSIGYIPPEYGMVCQVSVVGDIYSYGILLLEMFTGKRPTDDIFRDGLGIHRLTEMALPEHVMDIVDPSMPLEEDEEDADFEKNEDYIEESAIIEEAILASMLEAKYKIAWSRCCVLDSFVLQHLLISGCKQMLSSTKCRQRGGLDRCLCREEGQSKGAILVEERERIVAKMAEQWGSCGTVD